mgnify:FL=1
MQQMITEIQIVPIKPNRGLVGFASFVFDGTFHFGSIGILTRPKGGYRLTYPTRKVADKSLPVFYPINKAVAQQIEHLIIAKFEEVTKLYDRHDSLDT